MFTVPETRFHFGGDEYILAEMSKEMSVESNFKALAITKEIRSRQIPGVVDICPANASYLVHFNPGIISAYDLLDYLKEIDILKSKPSELNLSIRIVDIPIWYDDPITQEYSRRFKDRHPEPELTNFEFVMKYNHFQDKQAFIEAHTSMPHLISMIGFNPGAAWEFPLGLPREQIIQTPKYNSPRTNTPKQAVGLGGPFTVIYPAAGPGSYQLVGMSAAPTFHTDKQLADFQDSFFLARPGDLWKHRSIDESEYNNIRHEVEQGTYKFYMKEVEFSPEEYFKREKQYIFDLMKEF